MRARGCLAAAVLVACGCLVVVVAQPMPQTDLFTVEAHITRRNGGAGSHYCGSRLSEALKLLCNGEYNPYFKCRTKKTSTPTSAEYWDAPVQLPFRERLRAAALLESRTTRVTRGVYDECCYKSCTIEELTSYCANNTDKNSGAGSNCLP